MKVAVIGSGVAGLSTTWLLNEHSDHEVHLFEADDRVGGHTNTITFEPPQAVNEQRKEDGQPPLEPTPVDTGFIVFNEVTYPNFLRFLQTVGVEIIASDMSFAVSRAALPRLPKSLAPLFADSFPTITSSGQKLWPQANRKSLTNGAAKGPKTNGKAIADAGAMQDGKLHPELGAFEWAGGSPASLFCQLVNVFDPAHWRMVWDIIRFNHESLVTLKKAANSKAGHAALNESIGQWLDKRGYSVSFRRNYLIVSAEQGWRNSDRLLRKFPSAAHDSLHLVDPTRNSRRAIPSRDAAPLHAQPPPSPNPRPTTVADVQRRLAQLRRTYPL